jgi:NADPH:quinone reductase-like Zn-dependent oxidoreductase
LKAAVYYKYGGPEVVTIADVPEPQVKSGEVLVRVQAAGMNPKDAWIRSGSFRLFTGRRFPQMTGSDFCGLADGKSVFGYLNHLRGGAAAELLAVPEAWTAVKPEGVDPIVAAAIPCAYLTALQVLRDRGRVRNGSRVLIYGASGGVGTAATQLAHHFGAHITTVSSSRNVQYCLDNGAREAIAYDREDVLARPDQYDLIFQVYQGAKGLWRQARRRLAPHGLFVDLGGNPAITLIGGVRHALGLRSRYSHMVRSNRADLELLGRLAAEKIIDPHPEVLPLDKAGDAHARVESSHTRGKIVLRIQ